MTAPAILPFAFVNVLTFGRRSGNQFKSMRTLAIEAILVQNHSYRAAAAQVPRIAGVRTSTVVFITLACSFVRAQSQAIRTRTAGTCATNVRATNVHRRTLIIDCRNTTTVNRVHCHTIGTHTSIGTQRVHAFHLVAADVHFARFLALIHIDAFPAEPVQPHPRRTLTLETAGHVATFVRTIVHVCLALVHVMAPLRLLLVSTWTLTSERLTDRHTTTRRTVSVEFLANVHLLTAMLITGQPIARWTYATIALRFVAALVRACGLIERGQISAEIPVARVLVRLQVEAIGTRAPIRTVGIDAVMRTRLPGALVNVCARTGIVIQFVSIRAGAFEATKHVAAVVTAVLGRCAFVNVHTITACIGSKTSGAVCGVGWRVLFIVVVVQHFVVLGIVQCVHWSRGRTVIRAVRVDASMWAFGTNEWVLAFVDIW